MQSETSGRLMNIQQEIRRQYKQKSGRVLYSPCGCALMIRNLAPQAGDTIYDPACVPAACSSRPSIRQEHGGDENSCSKALGQEKNLTTSHPFPQEPFLHGAEDFHIERGDTLRHRRLFRHSGRI
jgi:type I restriction enzyme M protein